MWALITRFREEEIPMKKNSQLNEDESNWDTFLNIYMCLIFILNSNLEHGNPNPNQENTNSMLDRLKKQQGEWEVTN